MARHGLILFLIAIAPLTAAAESTPGGLPGAMIEDRGKPGERKVIEKALKELQRSPTISRLEKRRRFDFTVSFATGSSIEHGVWGRVSYSSRSARILVNESLIRSTRTQIMETLAHEIYGHALLQSETREKGVEHVLRLEENEAFAQAVGAVAACEVRGYAVNESIFTLGKGAAAYHAEVLFTDSPERLSLDRDEAKDARGAVKARLAELARRRRHLEAAGKNAKHWLWFFAHLRYFHRIEARRLKGVTEETRAWLGAAHPARSLLLDTAEPHLLELTAWLDSKEGRDFTTEIREAASHPYTTDLGRRLGELGEKLASCQARRKADPPAPGAPAADDSLTWKEIQEMHRRDSGKHASYFKIAPPIASPVPWLPKQLSAEPGL